MGDGPHLYWFHPCCFLVQHLTTHALILPFHVVPNSRVYVHFLWQDNSTVPHSTIPCSIKMFVSSFESNFVTFFWFVFYFLCSNKLLFDVKFHENSLVPFLCPQLFSIFSIRDTCTKVTLGQGQSSPVCSSSVTHFNHLERRPSEKKKKST